MSSEAPFRSLYRHGFVRVAVCIPRVKVADPAYNAERTLELGRQANEQRAAVALFPELGISGYSLDDLFHQEALLHASREALARILEESRNLFSVLLIGVPLRLHGALYNCGAAIYQGSILGLAPKSYIPNYREFYEKRQFQAGTDARFDEVELMGQTIPFGNDLILQATAIPELAIHMEMCEDVWVPIPPSTYAAFAGATVLANLSASNITIAKADYRRLLCNAQSAKSIAAYLYSAAGQGESTTDLAWDGHALIYENGHLLAEAPRFESQPGLITADIDLEALVQDRMRMTSYRDNAASHWDTVRRIRTVGFEFAVPEEEVPLSRRISRFPYVPSDPERRDERCFEAYNIQVTSLVKRLQATGIERVVVGISGGLDSTQALIVSARAMDLLGLPRTNVLAYTMPGFATSRHTLNNATALMEALGVTANQIDITKGCMQTFRDIGHPFARGEKVYDVTFENVQAGERTSRLFRLANFHDAMVVGTGDLSELALGWATYGVGDHMSHYAVNASVPKTLIQHLIRWMGTSGQVDERTAQVLEAILETEISPELIPQEETAGAAPDDEEAVERRSGQAGGTEGPAQSSEAKIGPYELQDFHLYYLSRYGFRPSKVAFLAEHAWRDRDQGLWPQDIPEDRRNQYDIGQIKHWLGVFLRRFIQTAQFKRSCLPNAPKVGSGGSLSPRGDWRAPSDASADAWLSELEENTPSS